MKRAAIWLPALLVALGAVATTAHGGYEVAVACRVPAAVGWIYPLITDGLALVAYAATTRLAGAGARYAWLVVVLAAGLSGLAQAAYLAGATEAPTTALRAGVGAWPAIAAAVVAHLLYLLASTPAAGDGTPEPAAERHQIPAPDLNHEPTVVPSPGPDTRAGEQRDTDRAAALIAAGAGRPRLAKELGIKESKARQLIEQHRNGRALT